MVNREPVGLVTWSIAPDGETAEIRAIVVAATSRRRGLGRVLLEGAAAVLAALDVRRAWLVTTNDNLAAQALYERAGWRVAAVRLGAMDVARRTLKPTIPEIGEHGIPIRDELELELDLERPDIDGT